MKGDVQQTLGTAFAVTAVDHLVEHLLLCDQIAQPIAAQQEKITLGQRLAEVRRLGFTKCLVPKRIQGKLTVPEGLELIRVANIREALAALL